METVAGAMGEGQISRPLAKSGFIIHDSPWEVAGMPPGWLPGESQTQPSSSNIPNAQGPS